MIKKNLVLGRLLAGIVLAAGFAQPRAAPAGDPAQAPADAPISTATNTDCAVVPWGQPQFTDGGLNFYPRPAWVLAACMDGGLWITRDAGYGWQPGPGEWLPELTTNRLLIHLDRAIVSNNLWIAVSAVGKAHGTLLASFYDNDLQAVAEPRELYAADRAWVCYMSAAEWPDLPGVAWFTNCVDLSAAPCASILSLSATNGMMRIFSSALVQERTAGNTAPEPAAPGFQKTPAAAPATLAVRASTAEKAASVVTAVATPVTWYVNASTGSSTYDGRYEKPALSTRGPKRTIADVLSRASAGDTIYVAAGTYNEHVTLNRIRMITKGRVVLP
jgi:hypothetical protein